MPGLRARHGQGLDCFKYGESCFKVVKTRFHFGARLSLGPSASSTASTYLQPLTASHSPHLNSFLRYRLHKYKMDIPSEQNLMCSLQDHETVEFGGSKLTLHLNRFFYFILYPTTGSLSRTDESFGIARVRDLCKLPHFAIIFETSNLDKCYKRR